MEAEYDGSFWNRFAKTTGLTGGIAVILVVFAARLGGGFDWGIFALAGAAVLLCWTRSWTLVPVHLRHSAAADAEWDRFIESDWKYVDIISAFSGSELDELRGLFKAADNDAIRGFVFEKAPVLSEDDMTRFIKYFNDQWPIDVTTYIDEDGKVRAMD